MEFSWTRRWIHICSTCFTYLLVNIQKTTGKLHVFWGWATINGHVHLPFQFLEGIIQCPSYWHTLEHGDVFKTLSIPFPLIMFQIHCSCYLIWLRERYIYIYVWMDWNHHPEMIVQWSPTIFRILPHPDSIWEAWLASISSVGESLEKNPFQLCQNVDSDLNFRQKPVDPGYCRDLETGPGVP